MKGVLRRPHACAAVAATGGAAVPTPVIQDVVTLGFRHATRAGDVLRAGSYGKQLTFTLSTTTP